MMRINDYMPIAKENETVFRNVLRDMKNNRAKRPLGAYIPEDLDTEATIDDLFRTYSAGRRFGKFTICDFTRPSKDSTIITFENVACMSGGGAELEYLVKPDNSVEYQKPGLIFRS